MKAFAIPIALFIILLCIPLDATTVWEMTGGVYRLELTTFDCGGALTTGSVYWHYFAFGQTEGVGSLSELSGSTYEMDIGVLPIPIPEPVVFGMALLTFCFIRLQQ
jgi:hypothetical protein